MWFNFTCPKCFVSLDIETGNVDILYQHLNQCCLHVACPICQERYYDESALINHYVEKHLETIHVTQISDTKEEPDLNRNNRLNERLPMVGDRVIAMKDELKSQYFPAIVNSFDEDSMKFDVDWVDGDTSGRIVDINNVASDNIPDNNELGVGTLVLFRQGVHDAGTTPPKDNERWHNGIITGIQESADGEKTYRGCHTKGEEGGKKVMYKGYTYEFCNLTRFDFRLAPNVFDVIHSDEERTEATDTDVYISYDLTDSYKAVLNNKVKREEIPQSYQDVGYENMGDPANIILFLKEQGFKVASRTCTGELAQKEIDSMIKNSKVFIGCLSDKYVTNNQCCMEFQYAKTSLQKPVIPMIVGDGSYDWNSSVIGMLISGEMYINYRNKNVEESKNAQLLKNIRKHIPADSEKRFIKSSVDTPLLNSPTEIFLSYCWVNSHLAKDAKEVRSAYGNTLADPRFLKSKIAGYGYTVWLDIERVASANANGGLYEQINQGLKCSSLVISCISDEYSKSQNCTMEFKYALKSLRKPVIPIVVGCGDEWRTSVVGVLLTDKEPVNLQEISTEDELDMRVLQIVQKIRDVIGRPQCESLSQSRSESGFDPDDELVSVPYNIKGVCPNSVPNSIRAPKVGDRVISHYQNCLYYMATVADFDVETMTYTVDWDDGDSLNRIQSFDNVALDAPPDANDIGVGSAILFPRGTYICQQTSEQYVRYDQGEVTAVNHTNDGRVTVSGYESKLAKSSDMIDFEDIPLNNTRVASNAFECLEVLRKIMATR